MRAPVSVLRREIGERFSSRGLVRRSHSSARSRFRKLPRLPKEHEALESHGLTLQPSAALAGNADVATARGMMTEWTSSGSSHIEQALNHRRLKLPLNNPRTAFRHGRFNPSQFPICAEAEYIASPHIHYAIKISAKCRK